MCAATRNTPHQFEVPLKGTEITEHKTENDLLQNLNFVKN
jgi:hypothetical protein